VGGLTIDGERKTYMEMTKADVDPLSATRVSTVFRCGNP